MDHNDDFLDKALEGFALFAFNKGEVCTCPSRALIQDSIFDKFVELAVKRVEKIRMGNPRDPTTMMGAQASKDQITKILDYIKVGKKENPKCLTGGEQAHLGGDLESLRDDRLRRVLHNQASGRGLAGKAILGNARVGGERFANFSAGPGHDIDDAGRESSLHRDGGHA